MPCHNCGPSGFIPVDITRSWFPESPCSDSTSGCSCLEAKNVCYTGINLSCSGVNYNDNLETVIQKIDVLLCSTGGDYTTYSMNCLPTWWGFDITTQAIFVDAITAYVCDIDDRLTTFLSTTFPNYQALVDERFIPLEYPDITCVAASVTTADSLRTILTKYCTKFGAIATYTDISAVTWNGCQTVISTPVTLGQAFQLLADQICNITASSLPTFDTMGSCLASPLSSNQTLEATVNKLITRTCLSPTWNASGVSWGCVTTPSVATDLEEAIQNIVDDISTLKQAKVAFNPADFSVVATTPSDNCDGVTVSLATPSEQDRFVASNAIDATPGTLIDKLIGVGISVDDTATPGFITLTSTATTDTFEVKASSGDTNPDFLDQKLSGGSNSGITITPSYNGGTEKVDLLVGVNLTALFDLLLDQLTTDSVLYQKFCEKVANCPSSCSPPTNVQAIAGTIPSTTTTTLP